MLTSALVPVILLFIHFLQVELHPLLAQRKLVGVSYRKGVVSVAHTPLGRRAPELLEHPIVKQIAAETGKTVEQVSWLACNRFCSCSTWGCCAAQAVVQSIQL
jgi:diketogulonate reductase-like aldo/keto reductase